MALICPVQSAGLGVGAEAVPCAEARCALWVQGTKGPGACALARIARYLAAGLGKPRREYPGEEADGGAKDEAEGRKPDDAPGGT